MGSVRLFTASRRRLSLPDSVRMISTPEAIALSATGSSSAGSATLRLSSCTYRKRPLWHVSTGPLTDMDSASTGSSLVQATTSTLPRVGYHASTWTLFVSAPST